MLGQNSWNLNSFRGVASVASSFGGPWTGWICSALVQMSCCSLGDALSWWCNAAELLLVVVVLHLSVVPRGRAIGLLATERDPPPECSSQGDGQSFLLSSRASRAVTAVPSFQTCLHACICKCCTCVCVYVHVCMCTDMYICIYMHVYIYMYTYACIYMWICTCMHACA